MENCCICGNEICGEHKTFCAGADKEIKFICEKCNQNFAELTDSEDYDTVRAAVDYLSGCLGSIADKEISEFIDKAIKTNSSRIDDLRTGRINRNTKTNQPAHLKQEKDISQSHPWIGMFEVLSWIVFVVAIFSGIVIAIGVGNGIGFLIFLGAFFGALLQISMAKVLVGIARHVIEIKDSLNEKNKD